jgi:hypothetical protein
MSQIVAYTLSCLLVIVQDETGLQLTQEQQSKKPKKEEWATDDDEVTEDEFTE